MPDAHAARSCPRVRRRRVRRSTIIPDDAPDTRFTLASRWNRPFATPTSRRTVRLLAFAMVCSRWLSTTSYASWNDGHSRSPSKRGVAAASTTFALRPVWSWQALLCACTTMRSSRTVSRCAALGNSQRQPRRARRQRVSVVTVDGREHAFKVSAVDAETIRGESSDRTPRGGRHRRCHRVADAGDRTRANHVGGDLRSLRCWLHGFGRGSFFDAW